MPGIVLSQPSLLREYWNFCLKWCKRMENFITCKQITEVSLPILLWKNLSVLKGLVSLPCVGFFILICILEFTDPTQNKPNQPIHPNTPKILEFRHAARHPQSQGCIERFNGTIKLIKRIAKASGVDWDKALNDTIVHYNNRFHSTIEGPNKRCSVFDYSSSLLFWPKKGLIE